MKHTETPVRCRIAGTGPERENLQNLIDRNGLAGFHRFVQVRAQRGPRRALRNVQFQHHDRDQNGDDAVAEGLEAILGHDARLVVERQSGWCQVSANNTGQTITMSVIITQSGQSRTLSATAGTERWCGNYRC